MTTIHANPFSVRRLIIHGVKQRPELLLLFSHVLQADELLLQVLFHMPPGVQRLFGFPLSYQLAQDDCETKATQIHDPIDCKAGPLSTLTTPTSKDDNFLPMQIEQLLPPPLMNPDKRQLVQYTVSLVPRKGHAEKREHFSLFLSLSVSQDDNTIYRSIRAVSVATKRLDLQPCLRHLPFRLSRLKN